MKNCESTCGIGCDLILTAQLLRVYGVLRIDRVWLGLFDGDVKNETRPVEAAKRTDENSPAIYRWECRPIFQITVREADDRNSFTNELLRHFSIARFTGSRSFVAFPTQH